MRYFIFVMLIAIASIASAQKPDMKSIELPSGVSYQFLGTYSAPTRLID